MGTSPPKQNELLSVTLRAKIVAAAASAALPPLLRTLTPAFTASCPPAATAPLGPDPFQSGGGTGCADTRVADRARSRQPGRSSRTMVGSPPRRLRLSASLSRKRRESRKYLPQQGEALGDRSARIFLAFELQGNVTAIIVLAQHGGNARVVQIEGVPQAPAVVCLGLHEDRFRRDFLQLIVGVFE